MSSTSESGTDAVIIAGARTPQGRLLGQLASFTAIQLGTHAIAAAIERSGIDVADVDYVIMGQVLQAGSGQNPARQSAIAAGVGWSVPAVTINKVCLSGIEAVIDAARRIRTGEASVVIAGGQESMTNAPHVLMNSRKGFKYGEVTMLDTTEFDGLVDAFDHESMGLSTEGHNAPLELTREQQDAVAVASHVNAAAAQAAGVFVDEIAPIDVVSRKGTVTLDADEGVRPDSTLESLGTLRPAFSTDGTITAGNSSPLSDGAAALVITSRSYAEEHGLSYLAVVGAAGQVAGPDNSLHAQPARAIQKALDKAGLPVSDLDLIEINEAFGAVAVRSTRDLGVSADLVNIHGGAIALGHPLGASGARVVLHAALELSRRGSGLAAAALCGGGGQGDAVLLSR